MLAYRSARGGQFVYELIYEGQGQDGAPFVCGLLDADKLKTIDSATMTLDLAGLEAHLAGGWRADGGGVAAGWRSAKIAEKENSDAEMEGASAAECEKTLSRGAAENSSYAQTSYVHTAVAAVAVAAKNTAAVIEPPPLRKSP